MIGRVLLLLLLLLGVELSGLVRSAPKVTIGGRRKPPPGRRGGQMLRIHPHRKVTSKGCCVLFYVLFTESGFLFLPVFRTAEVRLKIK